MVHDGGGVEQLLYHAPNQVVIVDSGCPPRWRATISPIVEYSSIIIQHLVGSSETISAIRRIHHRSSLAQRLGFKLGSYNVK